MTRKSRDLALLAILLVLPAYFVKVCFDGRALVALEGLVALGSQETDFSNGLGALGYKIRPEVERDGARRTIHYETVRSRNGILRRLKVELGTNGRVCAAFGNVGYLKLAQGTLQQGNSEQDIEKLLGEPTSTKRLPDGLRVLYYHRLSLSLVVDDSGLTGATLGSPSGRSELEKYF